MRQGDSLPPLPFNILLDYVMREFEMVGSGIEWSAVRRLRDLANADEICLLANDISDMRQ